jgi:hypothetical protein
MIGPNIKNIFFLNFRNARKFQDNGLKAFETLSMANENMKHI